MLNSEQKQNGLYCNFIAVKDNKAYKISEISVPDLVSILTYAVTQAAFYSPETVKKQLDDAAGIGGHNGKDS